MIPQLKSMISSGENTATKALSTLSAIDRYYTFLGGTLDVSAIIYLVTAAALFLFLTVQVIQKRRYAVSKKTIKFSAFSSAMVVILIVATVLINMAASQLPRSRDFHTAHIEGTLHAKASVVIANLYFTRQHS